MKTLRVLTLALVFVASGCSGQTKNQDVQASPSNKPQATIKVNKEYDKNGNLIRYDSTYSEYYSGVGKNALLADSIFDKFKDQFHKSYWFSRSPYFNKLFFEDSLLKYDFYKDDFFIRRFHDNMQHMDSLFMQMDDFKNDYFLKHFGG